MSHFTLMSAQRDYIFPLAVALRGDIFPVPDGRTISVASSPPRLQRRAGLYRSVSVGGDHSSHGRRRCVITAEGRVLTDRRSPAVNTSSVPSSQSPSTRHQSRHHRLTAGRVWWGRDRAARTVFSAPSVCHCWPCPCVCAVRAEPTLLCWEADSI